MNDWHRLSIAPMMSYTDRHFRYMMRLFTKRSLLYTEMVVGTTITRNSSDFLHRVLAFDPVEHPIAVQLGGDDPATIAQAARVCVDYGYDEINLNIGCPSDRVQKGRFGACLMKEPERVAEMVAATRAAVPVPVTVKHRIGVDDLDSYDYMARFVEIVSSEGGASVFAVHARKAWLQGLSPAQNRSVPPLDYEAVYRLKRDFPHLTIIINGGIESVENSLEHLRHLDGVMIGRAAYQQPEQFQQADSLIFGEPERTPLEPEAILDALSAYAHSRIQDGERLSFVAKHLVGLFKSRRNARLWRQAISELVQQNPKDFDLSKIYRSIFAA